ncbi:unnamed protein product [Fraxinus pennsylvanica]|uniref:Uncharacterized protein n=1 Tax=Fraxinus pennsylvanica TaxID=56036 RepID=A0AAD1YR19_9LAMI|nr:unnamed protein product [Fraxinus pennsylvanica]
MHREEVTGRDIAEIVSKWTYILVSKLQQLERKKLLHLEEELHRHVVGQDPAVRSVAEASPRSREGLSDQDRACVESLSLHYASDPHRPATSFMFMGPTVVEKTELAKAIPSFMFNTKEALVDRYGLVHGKTCSSTIDWSPKVTLDMKEGSSHYFPKYILNTDNDTLPKEMAYETMKKRVMEAARLIFSSEFMNRVDNPALDLKQISSIVRSAKIRPTTTIPPHLHLHRRRTYSITPTGLPPHASVNGASRCCCRSQTLLQQSRGEATENGPEGERGREERRRRRLAEKGEERGDDDSFTEKGRRGEETAHRLRFEV